ncbi:alpha-amylase family glycosyl hydrolase [Spirochaeta cellobiosiphila]|uniref:alpha-amylase family glycosyl hydrolase n=1 Tax=Spirochaeta cellobiosiphila TaxID=504483 RepID=UPI00041BF7F2|nr:alpha-amylase family glycosyl hydrolase [Spirochaeta cellobiosiphila]
MKPPLAIYSVYLRNHTPEGTFQSCIPDLKRIKDMGIDTIWLLPIHPIGQKNRKGSLGCPYSIQDYYGINPEYGRMADFEEFLSRAHNKGIRVIMDIVFNHTSYDSVLYQTHPEYFHCNDKGQIRSRITEWSDVIDLDHSQRGVKEYLIDVLLFWVNRGIDGFRCDVASLVPLSFWKSAYQACSLINDQLIWIGESIDESFKSFLSERGIPFSTDAELYQYFHALYEYDSYPCWRRALDNGDKMDRYMELIQDQECHRTPGRFRLRFIENHDQLRSRALLKEGRLWDNWMSFLILNRGIPLIYGGQEYSCEKVPSLFEKDLFSRDPALDKSLFIHRLLKIKQSIEQEDYTLSFDWTTVKGVLRLSWDLVGRRVIAFLNMGQVKGLYPERNLSKARDILNAEPITYTALGLVIQDYPMIVEVFL